MIPRHMIDSMVMTLNQKPDQCITVNNVYKNRQNEVRFRINGVSWNAPRYLYFKATGTALPPYIRLYRSCSTRGCQNPFHHDQRGKAPDGTDTDADSAVAEGD